MQCRELQEYGFDEEKILTISTATVNKLVQLLLRERVHFIVINMSALGEDPKAEPIKNDDVYVHSHLGGSYSYLAAPLSIDPELLKKLISLAEKLEKTKK